MLVTFNLILFATFPWSGGGQGALDVMDILFGLLVGAALSWMILGRRSRARTEPSSLESLARTLDVGVILLSSSGELEYANRRAESLLGGADLDAMRTILRRLHPMLAPALRALELSPDSRPAIEIEIPIGGLSRRLNLELLRIGTGGERTVAALVRERAALPALEADARLTAYVRTLARVHRAFAHEIRAPLNAMVLNLELLSLAADGRSDLEAGNARRSYLEVIKSELRRLTGMLETLLSHFQFSCNMMEPFDLRDLIRDLERLLDPYCRQNRVQLRISNPDQSIMIDRDRDAIQQALSMVVIETLEGMPEGETLELSLATDGRTATVTGSGAGAEVRPAIAGGSAASDGFPSESNHVGRDAARAVVDSLGGRMRVGTGMSPGHGFEIELPLVVAHDRGL